MKISKYTAIAIASALTAGMAQAQTPSTTINPSSDGTFYSGYTLYEQSSVYSSNSDIGAIKFSTSSISAPVHRATLALTTDSYPSEATNVRIYGYGSYLEKLQREDIYEATFLGTLTLSTDPANWWAHTYFFDVSNFVQNTAAPYLGFLLRADHFVAFSSLEHNYGYPSQLSVQTVPEPSAYALLLAGLGLVGWAAKRRRG